MSEGQESESGRQGDPELEYLQQLVSHGRSLCAAESSDMAFPPPSQIKDNEFLQRENLLLEAYLSKIDFSKIGIDFDDEVPGAKVRTLCIQVAFADLQGIL